MADLNRERIDSIYPQRFENKFDSTLKTYASPVMSPGLVSSNIPDGNPYASFASLAALPSNYMN
jgi:hypothetical protein